MISIEPGRLDGEAVAPLLADFHDEIEERYRDDEADSASADPVFDRTRPEEFVEPHGAFLVARLDGAVVGTAGVRPYPGEGRPSVAELKRMYVAPEARGAGVGRALLAAVVDAARRLGYERVVLETGTRQPEAIALYESAGWTPIPNYGAYRHAASSRCYELLLPPSGS